MRKGVDTVSETKLFVKRLDPRAQLPAYQTPGSAAMDLAALLDGPLTIAPGGRVSVPTGLSIALPDNGWVALLFPRSGLSIKHGVTLANCVGVIDSDYRGEIMVVLINRGEAPYTVQPGDRIAQLMLAPVGIARVVEAEALPDTQRGQGGFGSTGR